MPTIESSQTTQASPEQVWALLDDPAAWSRWGSWSLVEVEGGGPLEVGAIRRLVKKPYDLRERITEHVPNQRHSYELVDGMKVTGYRSTITLEPAPGGGTTIRWRSTYDSASPLTAVVLRLAVRDSAKRLARAA